MKKQITRLSLPQRQAGFSIIELMVAMLISVILLAGTAGLFVSNKRIYKEQDESGILQEHGRFAIQLLYDNIRMAGYVGCSDDVRKIKNNLKNNGTGDIYTISIVRNGINVSNVIEGFEKGVTNNWLPSGSTANIANIAPGTDAITVRYFRGAVDKLEARMASTSSTVDLPPKSTLASNQVVGISDCSGGDIFQITGVTAGHNLQHTNAANATATFSRTYDTSAEVSEFISRRFYIADNGGEPALFSAGSDDAGAGTMLIEGVEDMQLLYGVDINADQIADQFRKADAVGNWENVISVKVSILLRTLEENASVTNAQRYYLLDKNSTAPGDGYRRRVFATTILIRNRDI